MIIINMIVETTETGYSAYSENFPIFTTGKNIKELKTNSIEAAILYLNRNDIKVKLLKYD